MTSTPPSPIYLLLTNPSWAATHGYPGVISGLDGDWQFDPNETHGGMSVMAGLLVNWSRLRLPEEKLIPVLEKLLIRGATPSKVLDQVVSSENLKIHYCATQSILLDAASGKNLEENVLGAKLQVIASEGLNVQKAHDQITQLLDARDGWNSQIDGVPVLAWLALSCCRDGDMVGWSMQHGATTDNNVRKMRLLRHLAIESKAYETLSEADQLMVGSGMLMLASYYHSNAGESTASEALVKSALKVLRGRDDGEETFLDTLKGVFENEALNSKIKTQLAFAVVRGLTHVLADKDALWSCAREAIPFMYEDGKFMGDNKTLASMLFMETGLPGDAFWESMPHEAIYHDAMWRIAICSYPVGTYKKDASRLRLEFIDCMEKWASEGILPDLDMAQCKSWGGGHVFNNDEPLQKRLDEYESRVKSTRQANEMLASTTARQSSSSRHRL